MPKARFLRLFPEQDAPEWLRREVATSALPEQVGYYLSRLGSFEGINTEEAQGVADRLRRGSRPALTEHLRARPEDGQVVRLLDASGVAHPEGLAALRHAQLHGTDKSPWTWSANALGYLGDFDWLLEKAAVPALGRFAAKGCCANLGPFRDDNARSPVAGLRAPGNATGAPHDSCPARTTARLATPRWLRPAFIARKRVTTTMYRPCQPMRRVQA